MRDECEWLLTLSSAVFAPHSEPINGHLIRLFQISGHSLPRCHGSGALFLPSVRALPYVYPLILGFGTGNRPMITWAGFQPGQALSSSAWMGECARPGRGRAAFKCADERAVRSPLDARQSVRVRYPIHTLASTQRDMANYTLSHIGSIGRVAVRHSQPRIKSFSQDWVGRWMHGTATLERCELIYYRNTLQIALLQARSLVCSAVQQEDGRTRP